jgi:hypothetical protein
MWEAENWDAPQRRLDQVRVRGFAIAACSAVTMAKKNLEAAADRLARAQLDAEHARSTLSAALTQAELAARVVMVGDEEWVREVAQILEECFG